MITCQQCQTRFHADYQQGYPGHCDPPSALLTYAVLLSAAAGVVGLISLFALRTVMLTLAGSLLAGAVLSLSHIGECRRVWEETGGGICPKCNHKNDVKWYS